MTKVRVLKEKKYKKLICREENICWKHKDEEEENVHKMCLIKKNSSGKYFWWGKLIWWRKNNDQTKFSDKVLRKQFFCPKLK